MDPALSLLGVLLLALAVLDITWTTLWIEGGAGPLTTRLMAATWSGIRRASRGSEHLRSLSGPLILVGSLATWIILLWGGWTLVFVSGEEALIDTLDRGDLDWSDYVYFAGYTVFTLGTGDFVPRGDAWQLLTVLASASGLSFVTLAVTYVISVLGAVTQKRTFASDVSGLGSSGADVVVTSWDGEVFRGLDLPLHTLATELNTLTSNHKAYPIVHYFHSADEGGAPAHAIAVFDQALTLLRFGVTEDARPDDTALRSARAGVDKYLDTLEEAFVDPADRAPPALELASLREAGIPTISDEAFAEALTGTEQRRRLLLGLVESDGREWPAGEG